MEQSEKELKGKSPAQIKMEHAVQESEKVVKAMSRKVICLEEEILNIKDNNKINGSKKPFEDNSDYESSTLIRSAAGRQFQFEDKVFSYKFLFEYFFLNSQNHRMNHTLPEILLNPSPKL